MSQNIVSLSQLSGAALHLKIFHILSGADVSERNVLKFYSSARFEDRPGVFESSLEAAGKKTPLCVRA